MANARLVAGVDVGGTFTDVVLAGGPGPPRAVKVPTTPQDQGEGVVAGLAAARARGAPHVAHGTTTATNAVLERRVARTVLVTTAGFADVLVIGRQQRPSLYDLAVVRPAPVVARGDVVAVHERMGPDGEPVIPLAEAEVDRVVGAVAALEPGAVALSLLFSWASDAHERRLGAALRSRLGVPVTVSSELLPELREYERASTCALNAAVAPVMRRYLGGLADRLPSATITVMTSGGGWTDIAGAAAAPVHTLLSGPAAGAVAAAAIAAAAGHPDAVAFDMGGTSTDVCLVRDGRPALAAEATIGGLPFRTPAVDIHTVGAGGGSLAWIDAGGALRVGPRSAGARPGPACYGHGGSEPTVTDAHCALGHLQTDQALGGRLRLDVAAAERALATLPPAAGGATGVLTVVRAAMARALRRVTTERGVDPGGLALVAYGGAGPLHATALARDLGCPVVIVPPAPGVLSALGLLLAPARAERSRSVLLPVTAESGPQLDAVWGALADAATAALAHEAAGAQPVVALAADCRYAGQSHELRVGVQRAADLAGAFAAAHHDAYGYAVAGEPVIAVTLRAIAEGAPVLAAPPARWEHGPVSAPREVQLGSPQGPVAARWVARAALRAGERLAGPAVVAQPDSTTLLERGDTATVDAAGNLVISVG